MTPYEIHILLHYYVSPSDYEGVGEPILEGTLREFVHDGLLTEYAGPPFCEDLPAPKYYKTEKLNCYAEALFCVPLPTWTVLFPDRSPK